VRSETRVPGKLTRGPGAHLHHTLPTREADHCVIRLRPPGGGVDHQKDRLRVVRLVRGLLKHLVDVARPERRLQRVGSHAAQLRFNQIRSVLHNGLKSDHALARLPARHEMQHVLALRCLPICNARCAGELDLDAVEHGP